MTRQVLTASTVMAGAGAVLVGATLMPAASSPLSAASAHSLSTARPNGATQADSATRTATTGSITTTAPVSTARSGQWTTRTELAAAESSGPLSRMHGINGIGLPPAPNRATVRLRVQAASRGAARPFIPTPPAFVRPGTGRLTTCFCMRWGVLHEGIDLAAPYGSPIYAAGAGVVTRTGPSQGFGFLIIVQLPDGTENWYGHEEATLVDVGEHVTAGQVIARVGAEGESTGPHLHFQVMVHGQAVDPIPWLKARGVTI